MRRRDLLAAGAAAVAVGGAAAFARASAAPDPIIALVERHRAAYAEYLLAAGIRHREQDAFDEKNPHAATWQDPAAAAARHARFQVTVDPLCNEQERLSEIEEALAEEILATRATTLAGIAAKIEMQLSRDDQWCLDAGSDELDRVAQSVLADLRAMMQRERVA
jgi:hypothetical protein